MSDDGKYQNDSSHTVHQYTPERLHRDLDHRHNRRRPMNIEDWMVFWFCVAVIAAAAFTYWYR